MQLLGSTLSGIAHALGSGSRYTIASGDVSVAVFYGAWVYTSPYLPIPPRISPHLAISPRICRGGLLRCVGEP